MAQMRVGQVDMQTGEMLQGATLAVFYPKQKNGFTTGWIAMAQDPLMTLAKADIGYQAQRVLFAMLAKLDFENFISISQADIGRELNMKRPNVNRAMSKLIEEGIIIAGPRLQRKGTYSLNPQYGWKGSARGHQDALRERMKARGMSVIEGSAASEAERDTKTADMFDEKAKSPDEH